MSANSFAYEILSSEGNTKQYGFCNIIGMHGTEIAYQDCRTNDVHTADASEIKLQPLRF